MFQAVAKLPASEAQTIIKDILASLPSFKPPSSRGKELLDIILAQLRATLKSDLPSDAEHISLDTSKKYLDLALFITTDKRLAHSSHLLRFFYSSLATKHVLGRLDEDGQAYIIEGVARTLAVCEEAGNRAPPTAPAADLGKTPGGASEAAEDAALRRQFPDVCAVLLEVSIGGQVMRTIYLDVL